MKKKKLSGTATIEFNHSGIPDNELQPEEFSEYQLAVLRALPPDQQASIRKGCPIKVIDFETGNEIAAFNLKNIALTEYQKKELGRSLFESMQRYLSKPENAAKFEEWKQQRKEDGDA